MNTLLPTVLAFVCMSGLLMAADAGSGAPADLPEGLYAQMKTSKGEILIKLEFEKTPLTVANFVGLSEGKLKTSSRQGQPFYDGLTFHRVIPNFMIQGGDPEGSGRGGPGYKFADEFDPDLKHDSAGILSMANAGPGSNGSQFFITHNATPHLDNKHSVFGKVVKGQDVVNKIERGDKIEKVTILRIGEKAKAFKADQAAFDALKEKGTGKPAAANPAGADHVKDGQAFRDANKKKDGVKETASGLQYRLVKHGEGQKPKATDTVTVHYRGSLVNGNEFDSSYKRGEAATFRLNQVIPGWTEALQLMSVGDKAELVIPPGLAYAERGAGGVIPPNATLVFEVELIKIN